jgi:hypothetical protein
MVPIEYLVPIPKRLRGLPGATDRGRPGTGRRRSRLGVALCEFDRELNPGVPSGYSPSAQVPKS